MRACVAAAWRRRRLVVGKPHGPGHPTLTPAGAALAPANEVQGQVVDVEGHAKGSDGADLNSQYDGWEGQGWKEASWGDKQIQ